MATKIEFIEVPFIRWVLTHREYDEWNKQQRKGR
jgi:mRNA-degrading endonuclease HigB of HigAB toxin-antitoxin module